MNFEVFEILEKYDGGVELFVLIDEDGCLYLGHYYETCDCAIVPYESFLLVEISSINLYHVKNGKMSISEAFENSWYDEYFIMTTTMNSVDFKTVYKSDILDRMWPLEGYFYEG